MADKNYILTQEQAYQKLERLALEVAERLQGDDAEFVIIGVRNSGLVIAEKIGVLMKKYLPNPVEVIAVQMDKDFPVDVILSK